MKIYTIQIKVRKKVKFFKFPKNKNYYKIKIKSNS